MFNQQMYGYGSQRSAIRDLFEYGLQRKAAIGADKVFDFSLGNPSIPAPALVNDTIRDLVDNTDSVALHGYTSAAGDLGVRTTIAESLNRRFGLKVRPANLYMTVGAAASLASTVKALCEPGDEFLTIAPFFPEYRVFCEGAGAKFSAVPADTKDFQIDFEALESMLGPHTKGLIINSPNNPSGVVFSAETLTRLGELLRKKSAEKGEPIFLISDEPYREIVYDGVEVPFVCKFYSDTIVCYSFSKSLSLPGERIGYVLVGDEVTESEKVYASVAGAARALGYVCAPSLFQRVAAACCETTGDIDAYKANRDLLLGALTEYGYTCVKPQGAFYLFVKALEADAAAFCERAKKHELLLVPSDSFGVTGYVRISYCVDNAMIRRALPAFKALAEEYAE